MIPKIIHQIWLGDIPEKVQKWINTWDNVGFEHILWRENIYDEFGGKEHFLGYYELNNAKPAFIVDILRVLLIQKYGGFYIDCDCSFKQDLTELTKYEFITNMSGINAGGVVCYNEFFGSVKNHRVLATIMERYNKNRDTTKSALWKYGYSIFNHTLLSNLDTDITFCKDNKYFTHHMLNSWC